MPDYPVRLKKYPGQEYGWFAEVPSLPYCTSNGRTKAEVLRNIREAIQCHLEGLARGIPRKKAKGLVTVRVPVRLEVG